MRQHAQELVLALARDQPGHTRHHRRVAEAVAPSQRGPGLRIGPEHRGVHPGRQRFEGGVRAERRGEAAARIAGDDRDDVGVAPDPAQRLPGERQHGPADLMPVRTRDHPPDPGVAAQVGTQQRERRGRAEPDGRRPVRAGEPGGPAGDGGHRQHQRGGVPVHGVGGCRVEFGRPPARTGRRPRSRRAGAGRPGPAGSSGSRRRAAGSRWSPAGCAPHPHATGGDRRGMVRVCRAAAGWCPAAARHRGADEALTGDGRR